MVNIDALLILRKKIRDIADGFRASSGTTATMSLEVMAEMAKQGSKLIEDVPTTPGQWACLARASQMRDIVYKVEAEMSANTDTEIMRPGVDYRGLIYSSVRGTEWGFIGFPTSLYSYLTALNNPKSAAYTRKYTDYFNPNGVNINVSNVFGTNCSSYVSYCIDLPYLKTTNTLPLVPSIEEICYDSASSAVDTTALQTELKLCDFPISNSHAVLITGIRRNTEGLIREVDVSDSWPPRIRMITYAWDEFVEKFITKEGYRVYRYKDLESVSFPPNLHDIVYSDICTSRGDKVCIRPDQDISINVLNVGEYDGIALFKDGVQIGTHSITEDAPDWELTGLTTGKYTAILHKSGETVTMDDVADTNSTSFIVCAVSATVSRSENKFSFTSEAINGVHPVPVQVALKDSEGYTRHVEVIENDNFTGSGTTEFVPSSNQWYIVHVPFKTEYGFIIAETADWTLQ